MRINLGSGPVGADSPWATEEWLNIDLAYGEAAIGEWQHAKYMKFDFRNGWPLEQNSADCIFASHVVEHIDVHALERFFTQMHNTLKEGAPVRIICPDPRIFIRNWQYKNTQFIKDCYGVENWDRWDYENNLHLGFTDMFFGERYSHAICPSIDWIAIWLIKVGFSEVCEMSYGNTKFPEFFGTDQPDGHIQTMDNRPELSWYLEAVK